MPALLELPTDRPRQAVAGDRRASHRFELPAALTRRLREFGQARDASLFMVLLAAFELLLHRYCGQDEFWVGTGGASIAPDLPDPVRLQCRLDEEIDATALIERVRRTVQQSIVRSGVQSIAGELPQIQVMLDFAGESAVTDDASPLDERQWSGRVARFAPELACLFRQSAAGLSVFIDYDANLFDSSTVLRLQEHLSTLLDGFGRHPHGPLRELPMLSMAERRLILVDWNDTAADYPAHACLHQLFEEQVGKTPDATAVIHAGAQLSYAELNRRANRLAHKLRVLGVGPDSLVGICVDRSIEMVVGVLGILKAGGAYVPLDPTYPADRIAFMLADSNPKVLLTQQRLLDHLPDGSPVLCMDRDWPDIATCPPDDPVDLAGPGNLAYVIYTSGSTGRPKGVMIEHRNSVNFICWARSVFTPQQLARTLFSTSLNFDLSVFDLFVPLTVGAATAIVPNALDLTQAPADITLINTVPSAIDSLIGTGAFPQSIRTVNSGGEALARAVAERIFSSTRVDVVCNLYGPTETSTYSTWVAMHRSEGFVAHIGRPIANTTIYILDRYLNPVPAGVIGELYIGGAGVARGYLNRPDLTGQRFVADPFGAPGGRLYKTGDLARYSPHGNIVYLGRNDFQVKVRGFRIELGEIEACMLAHPAVHEAVVLARASESDALSLVAYYVPKPEAPSLSNRAMTGQLADAAALRAYLAGALPEYMVPAACVELASLPRTPNGKLDRQALPAPGLQAYDTAGFEAPAGELEIALARIWTDVLELERVGRQDNFFDLGGHSLMAVQIANRVRQSMNVEFTFHQILANQTVAALAASIGSPAGPREPEPEPELGDPNRYFATPAQSQVAFFSLLTPGNRAYLTQSMLAFSGPLDVASLHRALQEVVDRHQHLRTTYGLDDDGSLIATIQPGMQVELPLYDLRPMAESARATILDQMSDSLMNAGIDPQRLPLVKWFLFHLSDHEYRLLMIAHHHVHDGWSLRTLLSEMAEIYTARVAGREYHLPVPTQFSRYARWQRDWLKSEAARKQTLEWVDYLRGSNAVLTLPFAAPRPGTLRLVGGQIRTRLPGELIGKLQSHSTGLRLTLFQVLFGAFALLLRRYTGRRDFLLGTASANRSRADWESLLGMLVNVVAVRIACDEQGGARDWLTQCTAALQRALALAEIPLSMVVDALKLRRMPGVLPLLQVQFNAHNALTTELPFGDLDWELTEVLPNGTAKFDLGVTVVPRAAGMGADLLFEFNCDLFDGPTVLQVAQDYRRLLERLVATPTLSLSELLADDAAAPSGPALSLELPSVASTAGSAVQPDPPVVHQVIEDQLKVIWSGVLQLDTLGPDDDFFECGGHSILAMRLVARIRREMGLELAINAIFEAPTVRQLAARLSAAGPLPAPAQPLPGQRTSPAIAPMSSAQEALWFLDQLLGASDLYNLPQAVRLGGALDVAALERSVQAVVERHASLRTAFEERDGAVWQVVQPRVAINLAAVPVAGATAAQRERELLRLLDETAGQPFDLSQAPLLRARLFRLDQRDHVLQLVIHHIVSDGWSMGVMSKDLNALYAAFTAGKPSPLVPLKLQFTDFVLSQRKRLQDANLQPALDYWRRQLAGLKRLRLSSDRPRPAQPGHGAGVERLTLPDTLVVALRSLAARENATLFMVLLAAFNLLLMRQSGQDDIAVGTPHAGREDPELDGLIGYFINTLVLRTDLSGNPRFDQLLERVRDMALQAYGHAEVPFDRLVAELRPQREPDVNPLFEVMINFSEGMGDDAFALSGLTAQPVEHGSTPAKFTLTLYIEARDPGMQLSFVYRSDRISQGLAANWLDQFACLLNRIVEAPRRMIQSYSLVTDSARALLPDPTVGIAAAAQLPITSTILQWAGNSPQGIAVRQGVRQWSYGELADRAAALARTLRLLGAGRGDVVAIQGRSGFALVGTMLAVALSGAAFMTIEPGLPLARRQVMLRESRARLLCLVGSVDPAGLSQNESLALLRVDEELTGHDSSSGHAGSLPVIDEGDPAYVFFTSGSTGRPKAVLGSHKGLSHFLRWQQRTFSIGPDDRVAQLIGLSFDPLLRDVFLPLISGAALCIPEEGDLFEPLQWLCREQVSVIHTTPSLLQSWLVDAPAGLSLPALRWVFVSGEPLNDALIHKWRQPSVARGQLVNLYGPTETTLAKCFYPIPAEVVPGIQAIGSSMPGCQALVLDAAGQMCGVGEAGEIVLRTPFRSLGYLNLPEESRARFRKNSFRDDEDDLLYYTGDGGRYRPDGQLEILGRLDDQVKVRGVRVEPGEASATLSRHPAVRSCTVVSYDDGQGITGLAAYVVGHSGKQPDARELRDYLEGQLADSLVPRYYVFLDALPLLPNGKINRAALPAPQPDVGRAVPLAPRTPVENVIAGIWGTVLGVADVGVYDNFFELGGNSLLAIRMTGRVRAQFDVDLPLRTVFEEPRLDGFAARLDRPDGDTGPAQAAAASQSVAQANIPIPHAGPSGPVPLTYAQEGLWFVQRLLGPSPMYNVSQVIRHTGPLDLEALRQSLEELVNRHGSLRTEFLCENGVPGQRVLGPVRWQLSVERLTGPNRLEREEQLRGLLRERSAQPFELSQAPLLRTWLWQLGDEEHVLLVVLHHIVTDGWSMGVLVRELAQLYEAHAAGRPGPLAVLPIQFADFALWQRRQVDSTRLHGQLQYWRERLAGLPALRLPADRARPAQPTYRGSRLRFELDGVLTGQLRALARMQNATLFMVLVAGFQTLLMRWTGQQDLAVGTPVAGRDRSELEGLIGYFVNMLVLRADLSGDPGFVEFLARVRREALQAYGHQQVPFDQLVAELRPQRELGTNPLFQVSFSLHDTPEHGISLPGFTREPLPVHSGTSKFDLSMALAQSEGALRGQIEYSTELFEAASIERLCAQYQCLLAGIVAEPASALSRLPLIDSAERARLLACGRGSTARFVPQGCLHQLFEQQVQRTPQACALVFEGASLSYEEMNARANRLAHHLRALGVGPDRLVGLCLPRGMQMIVALLGIVKAGGAYVPLDPQYPQQRLAFMVQDAAPQVLLTEHALCERFAPWGTSGPGKPGTLAWAAPLIVCMDRDAQLIDAQPSQNLPNLNTPDNLVYVIYTSGSTGQPKGVLIEHRAVIRLVIGTDYVELGPDDCVAQASNHSFDAATFEVWGALLNGARLAIVARDVLLSARALSDRISADGINTMFLTTALFNELATEAPGMFTGLDNLLFGGEAADPRAVARVLQSGPPRRFANVYGPTEAATFATSYPIAASGSAGPSRWPAGIPIGKPIAGTQIHILDRHLEPTPAGMPGEIHIGGVGVARGYLNRPESSARQFVADPFSPGGRLYKTGDLGCWLPDGNIAYRGRIDRQIKLRGFRIEPGEIENALRRCPGVRDAVVMAHEGSPGDMRLVAWVAIGPVDTPRPGERSSREAPDPANLRRALQQDLPDYMIPAAFVLLDSLALTANGKIDRGALTYPEPSKQRLAPVDVDVDADADADAAIASGPNLVDTVEAELIHMWEDLLGTRPVGVDDNFFELGGHSLLGVRLLAAIEHRFGRVLRLAALFELPTIRKLAAELRSTQTNAPISCVVSVQAAGDKPPVFFVSGWGGAVLVFNRLARELGSDQPLYVLDTSIFGRAPSDTIRLEDVAARMIEHMRAVQPVGPYHLCGFSLGGKFVYEMAQQLLRSGEQVSMLALMDCYAPGYPISRSFAVRTLLHLRHALGLGPAATLAYLTERVRRLKKYFVRVDPKLFAADQSVGSTAIAKAMQQSADVMLKAWKDYQPAFYAGHLVLIRAGIKDLAPGVDNSDPQLGWGRLVGAGIEVHSLNCNHRQMLDPEHAGALAAILSGCTSVAADGWRVPVSADPRPEPA